MSAVIDADANALFDLGISALEKGDYHEAEGSFRRTLTRAPESLETLLNLGYVLDKQGRPEEALRYYESVLEISPTNAKARYNRAVHLLRAGDLGNGFAEYESRFTAISNTDNRVYSQPRWDGSPLAGRSILIYCEQGLGDALQFSRYIPWVAGLGGRVVLEAQQPLVSLLSTLPEVEETVVKSAAPPVTDCHIPLLSLPHIFKTTLDTVPARIPYIVPDPSKVAQWRQKLAGDARLRIGLAWRGSATNPMDRDRSCALAELAPLLAIPGISLYSLQVGCGADEIRSLPQHDNLIDMTNRLDDFSDTAALIANLDLVISVDTAVVHLAGAVGKPVWIMLAHWADWRWMSGQQTSPWYPTASLFRQPKPGDWRTVIANIAEALRNKLPSKGVEKEASAEMPESSFQLALTALDSNTPEAAIPTLRALSQSIPDELAVWFNLGRAYELTGRFEEAADALERAHELKPESVDVLLHLGAAFVQQNKVNEAFECCRRMLTLQPDNAVARYNLAFLQLRTGDYPSGFANFEARLAVEAFAVDDRHYPQPRWDGTPLEGKSILVFGEQGMGDVIQFVRYIPLLIDRGGKVVLEVDPPLIPLFKDFPGIEQVIAKSKTPPRTDLYIQLLSLPHLLGTTLETVPRKVPYIFPDQTKVEAWRQCLASHKPAFRIGLVWRGNPLNPLDRLRSCPLEEFSPLASFPGISFYSLQVGSVADEIDCAASSIKLIDHTDRLHDFSDTAAFLANLDLVIGVDTAVTHLAGALGKQVWVILPKVYDWRWLVGRDYSPWYPTGRVFWQQHQGDWTGAITCVKEALGKCLAGKDNAAAPMDIEACYSLGMQLKEEGDLAGAGQCFQHIVEQAPDLPDPQHSLGVVLHLQGRIAEAISHYRSATILDPVFVKAHYNLANACQQCGLYQDAIAAARTTILLDPSHTDAHWLLGTLLLQQGDFAAGWPEYEWRWRSKEFTSRIPELGRPLWDGSPLAGRTLLIHMEQGRGDMIQFIRYAPLVAALGGRVVVCALPELVSLLATVEGADLVVDRNGPLPEFDLHIPVQSLPHRLETIMASIPATVPYLQPPAAYRAKWAGRSTDTAGCLRIGVVWEGNKTPDPNRSYPSELLSPLLDLPFTAFYSLQVGGQDVSASVGRLIDCSAELCDFSDTAALIETLDLVISIDTAVAHLSGALGKPTWTLLPFVSDWRWLLDRDDTPWYPSMRLFRQRSPGDWAGILSAVQQALVQLLDDHGFSRMSGIDLLRSGDVAGAERLFAKTVARRPDDAEAHCNRGVALDTLGRHEEAVACYRAALSLKADYMQAVYNMGNTYVSLGKPDHAQRCYEHALELSPGLIAAHLALGGIGKSRHDFSMAHGHYQAALLIDPMSVEALEGVAETLQAEERYVEAIAAYRRVLALAPARVSALTMLGSVYQCLEQPEDAEACYRQVLALEPGRATALNNLGVALNARGKLDEAIVELRHLVEIHPDYAEGHWNLSVALLAAGHYTDGWQEFEWRFKKSNPVPQRLFEQPRWDGSPLDGRTILLHAEQGFGDTIQFVRYLPLVVKRGGRIVIECQVPALKRLLLSLDGVAQVIVAGEPLPYFDSHLPMMSLPLVFDTTVETIPSQSPYLAPEPADVQIWQRRLGPATKFRVGLVWHAKQSQVLNRKRSCPLRMFAPLWAVPGVEFYTLQIGDGSEQLRELGPNIEIIDLTHHINDFADTAAFMANLDLVINIDTVTAHLAGALGVQALVVLPHVAEWRWLQQRSDSPWYPNMQLFRQPARGDWPSLMNSVAYSLNDRVHAHRDISTSASGTRVSPGSPRAAIRVGLAWSGRQDNPLNRKRSCPFSALEPLFAVPNVTFVNLQLEAPDGLDPRLIDLSDQICDFEDTAALMANLDLIISIDTSVAHLAAASGRPTWVLLSHVADWRWSTDRTDSPWYPGIQLFRQPDHGDWDTVIREVTYRLAQLAGDRSEWNHTDRAASVEREYSSERQLLEQQLERHQYVARLHDASPDAHLDVGASLALLGRHNEAAVSFRRALELDADHNAAHLNLAYSLLSLGKYSEGWQHLEWRIRRIPAGQLPPWPMLRREQLGTHPEGTSVLVHCEQGYGDTIQFARFLPMLAEAGFRVIVSCQPPILPLVASMNGVSQVVPHGDLLPGCDLQVLMLSLAGLYSTGIEHIPANTPYLTPRPMRVEMWGKRLDSMLGRT